LYQNKTKNIKMDADMIADGAPALHQPVPVVVIKRGVGFKPVLETGGETGTFSMEKLKELLNEEERQRKIYSNSKQYRGKPPKNQKRPKTNKQRM
jgi:hypothetical protein